MIYIAESVWITNGYYYTKNRTELMHFSCFFEQFSKLFCNQDCLFFGSKSKLTKHFCSLWQIAFFSVEKRVSHERLLSAAFSWVPFYQFPELCRKAFFGCFYDGGMWEPLFIKKYRELWRHLKGHLGRGTHHPSKPIYQKRWLLDQLLLFTILYWVERIRKCWR